MYSNLATALYVYSGDFIVLWFSVSYYCAVLVHSQRIRLIVELRWILYVEKSVNGSTSTVYQFFRILFWLSQLPVFPIFLIFPIPNAVLGYIRCSRMFHFRNLFLSCPVLQTQNVTISFLHSMLVKILSNSSHHKIYDIPKMITSTCKYQFKIFY